MLVIIDNYDSFTYNIVQTIAGSNARAGISSEIKVFRNDKVTLAEIESLNPERLLISPGPGVPADAGITIEAIRHFSNTIPVLGICLGHQAIGEAFGGTTIRAGRIMHGKTSPIHHDNSGVFQGLENPFTGMRYHSLVSEEQVLPSCLMVSARTEIGELMGLRHKTLPVEGVQFHPESIMTKAGIQLLENFTSPEYPRILKEYQQSLA